MQKKINKAFDSKFLYLLYLSRETNVMLNLVITEENSQRACLQRRPITTCCREGYSRNTAGSPRGSHSREEGREKERHAPARITFKSEKGSFRPRFEKTRMPGLFEGLYCSWSKTQHIPETTVAEYFYQRDSRKPNLTSNSRDRDGKIVALTSTLVPPTLFSVCNSAFFIHRMLISQKSSHHARVKTLRYTRLTTAHNVHCLKRSRLKHVGMHCSLDRDYLAYAFKDAKNRAHVYIHVGCAVSDKFETGSTTTSTSLRNER